WLYRTLLLDGDGVDQRTEVLRADPQSPAGWQVQRLEQQHYRGLTQLPGLWYSSDGASFGEGDLPHLGLAHLSRVNPLGRLASIKLAGEGN
ncbi:MAG: hypothetical protein INF62_17630, partial [Roseomonas sp.]|nr:hypothetical protein [Roseomonas sp.]